MPAKEISVTLKFDSVEEMNAYFSPQVGGVKNVGKTEVFDSSPVAQIAPPATETALVGEILDPTSDVGEGDDSFDEVTGAHDSTEYLDFMRASIPVIGKETLKKIMLKAGHVTTAGTPAGVKDPLPSPALQIAIMSLVEKVLAVRGSKTETPAQEAAATTEPVGELTVGSYRAKIDEYLADPAVAMAGLRAASIAVGHVNPKGSALDPRTAAKDKWAAILGRLETFKAGATAAA